MTSETTPLLGDSRLPQAASARSSSLSRERFRLSPETLLIPVVLATRLGDVIPTTTFFELVRQAVCRLSIPHRGPSSLVAGGLSPAELCDAPEITRDFATVIAILSALEGIIRMFVILSVATMVAQKRPSDCRVWHLESYLIALWEETSLRIRTCRRDCSELSDTRVTVCPRLAR